MSTQYFLIALFIYALNFVHTHADATGQLKGLASILPTCRATDLTQVLSVGSKGFYPLSHLTVPIY